MIDYQEAQRLIGHLPLTHWSRKASTELHMAYALRTLPGPCSCRECQKSSLHRGILLCLMPGLARGIVAAES